MANEDKGRWFLPLVIGAAVAGLVTAIIIAIYVPGDPLLKLKLAIGYGALVLVFLFGFEILAAIASDKINISELLEDDSGGASTSRFQLVIFMFVIGLSFLLIVATSGKFPDLPTNVLALLGISATTYGVSKGIAKNRNGGTSSPTPNNTPQTSGSTGGGAPQTSGTGGSTGGGTGTSTQTSV
jgi:hypothetical protein